MTTDVGASSSKTSEDSACQLVEGGAAHLLNLWDQFQDSCLTITIYTSESFPCRMDTVKHWGLSQRPSAHFRQLRKDAAGLKTTKHKTTITNAKPGAEYHWFHQLWILTQQLGFICGLCPESLYLEDQCGINDIKFNKNSFLTKWTLGWQAGMAS